MSQKNPLEYGRSSVMRYKILLLGVKLDIWPSHPFALAGDFFEKLTDVNFVYFM